MSYQVYKLVHFLGIFMLFVSLGAVFIHAANAGKKADNKARKLLMVMHGLGAFLVLLGGFGMMARLEMAASFPGWIIAKLIIWGALGGLVALPYRKPASTVVVTSLLPVLGLLAAYFALYKPF